MSGICSYTLMIRKNETRNIEKTVYENKDFDKPKHDRKEYMKEYMQKRRIEDSFRKKSNELSQRSKNEIAKHQRW